MAKKHFFLFFIMLMLSISLMAFGQGITNAADKLNSLDQYFSEWDTDETNQKGGTPVLSKDEFFTGLQKEQIWEELDTNDDSGIDRNEFNMVASNLFKTWEMDNSGNISRDKFNMNPGWPTGLFDQWDRDRNGQLNEVEFGDGIFSLWDTTTNGKLDFFEFANGLFDTIDMDNDGFLTMYEMRVGIHP